ncbi:MAG: hypothetical protein AB7T74_04890 [Clostridia bacterium]
MTIQAFISACVAYFGPWPEHLAHVATAIAEYLRDEVHPRMYEAAFLALRRSHSIRYGAPDVSDLELAMKRAKERGANLRRPYQDPTGSWSSSGAPETSEPLSDEDRANVAQAMALFDQYISQNRLMKKEYVHANKT